MVAQTLPRPRQRRLRRGLYLLPSLFTLGNIFLGFYAVVRALREDYRVAGIAIIAAAVLDALDGRIARLTGTESEFGKQYDSLADVLTFGSAPALVAYLWGLHEIPRLGWLVCFFFIVCGATRLARFNVQTRVVDSRYFAGLPIPAAAGVVATFLLVAPDRDARLWLDGVLLVALVTVGLLMVSTFRYPSFKKIDFAKRRSYRLALLLAAMLALVVYRPSIVLATLAVLYTLSGPALWALGRVRRPGARGAGET
ncbi:MAG TPA: CDP-diacylglycerol--serine O-phosphatidyltransferase [Thermoanaerobaculia bacterium]|nr:CDP-diacylglycerol--serine O-phosphatidyltransferase [Thermoanaerobaculia bacterium]